MLAITVLLLSATVGAVLADNHLEEAERLLNRLDLKNYDEFRSEREKTSTDSTDSSSDANRIARAVEAALEAAELADRDEAPKVEPDFETLRLRLSTTNAAGRCPGIVCENIARAGEDADIDGATVTVTTSAGDFTATFDGNVAENKNDQFRFTVTYDNNAGGDDTFTIETFDADDFGVNVTAITIASAGEAGADSELAFFRVAESSDFDDETLLTDDETLRAVPGSGIVECDVDFNGAGDDDLTGVTSYSIEVAGERTQIVTRTPFTITPAEGDPINIGQTQTFGGNLYIATVGGVAGEVGFADLPCASRGRVIYDNIAIVTKRAGQTSNTQDTLQHPLVYDSLAATARQATPNFENFLNELRQAAGRGQLRLRDIVLDTGVFSDLSHNSKFTPCFRVFPDEDYEVEIYVGLRVQGGVVGSGQIVRGSLNDNIGTNDLVQNGEVVFDPEDPPAVDVAELVFEDLDNDDDDARPFEELPSDVTMTVEACEREFSYFA